MTTASRKAVLVDPNTGRAPKRLLDATLVDTAALGVETARAEAAEALKAPLESPTFTGTVTGISKSMVGLGNVDNTPDASKPVSTAQAAADTGVQAYAVQRANHTGTQTADTITDGTTNKAYTATERTKLAGIATGATLNRADSATDALLAAKADLVGGLIPSAQIPAIALTNAVTVANQAAMLALTTTQVQPGDVAVRTDGAGTFILTATDPTVLGNWVRLNAPTDAVTTVNGQSGTVVLNAANVGADPAGAAAAITPSSLGLGNVTNTSDANKPVSTAQQAALDSKLNISDVATGITPGDIGAEAAINRTGATAGQVPVLQGDGTFHLASPATTADQISYNSTTVAATLSSFAARLTALEAGAPLINNTATPTLTGPSSLGSTLTVSNGTWAPTPDSYTYAWKRDGTAISGATASTYAIKNADVGHAITATVTAVRTGYTNSPASTSGTTPVGPTFTDDFSTAFNWGSRGGFAPSTGAGNANNVGGRLQLNCTNPASIVGTGRVYDITSYPVEVQVTTVPPVGLGSRSTSFKVYDASSNNAGFIITASGGVNQLQTACTGQSNVNTPYDATAHAWMQILVSGGNLIWQVSPDGKAWTNIRSIAAPSWAVGGILLEVRLASQFFNASETGSYYSEFDNLNVIS